MPPRPCLKYFAVVTLLLSGLLSLPALASLSLEEAETLATKNDPLLLQLEAESRLLMEQSVADNQWPDPRLKMALIGMPTDSYDLDQENMTQQQVGFQQMIPRGDSLEIKQNKTRSKAEIKDRKVDLERLAILRDVRLAYIDIVFQKLAHETVLKSKKFLSQFVEIAQFRYSSGKEKKQRILEASLAHSRMDDRLLKITDKEKIARAKLAKWIGRKSAFGEIPAVFPEFDDLPNQEAILNNLQNHPAILLADSKIKTSQFGVKLAEEKYKPAWMTDLTYGYRRDNKMGVERSNLLSVMVSLDIPLFTKNRQDRIYKSRTIGVEAAQHERDDKLRMLQSELEMSTVNLDLVKKRLKLFTFKLIPEAVTYTQTTLAGYQSGVTDINGVIRAHLTELKVRLDKLKLQHAELSTQTKLLFLIGEKK
ncbi:MAG: TolC family protein [Magnetococcales bacterium]|nr:TolC family protein [Magnetococcales bacterium]